jgi:RsiW-degrading membrane proteinase PrsW (M82 family)
MLLFALSIAPGLAISLYIFLKDQFNREPKLKLFICFLLGCLSILPALLLEIVGGNLVEFLWGKSIYATAILAYVVVGFSEEFSKYIMVRMYAFPKNTFDEPFDGIVYCVMVSMGFATLENIFYVFEHGFATAIMRMFLSVPAHATFAIIMGYYVGMAKFDPSRRKALIQNGLLGATFFHGTYDFFLFLGDNNQVTRFVNEGLLFIGAVASFIIAIVLSRKAIRIHLNLSQKQFQG